MAYIFDTISVTLDRGVLFATVKEPPCNVLSVPMMMELTTLANRIAQKPLNLQSSVKLDPTYWSRR